MNIEWQDIFPVPISGLERRLRTFKPGWRCGPSWSTKRYCHHPNVCPHCYARRLTAWLAKLSDLPIAWKVCLPPLTDRLYALFPQRGLVLRRPFMTSRGLKVGAVLVAVRPADVPDGWSPELPPYTALKKRLVFPVFMLEDPELVDMGWKGRIKYTEVGNARHRIASARAALDLVPCLRRRRIRLETDSRAGVNAPR